MEFLHQKSIFSLKIANIGKKKYYELERFQGPRIQLPQNGKEMENDNTRHLSVKAERNIYQLGFMKTFVCTDIQ
ncbi:hypothetical protein ACTXT7_003872 [Hymenolepis weldensis]